MIHFHQILANDFLSFALMFFSVLWPGTPIQDNWHLEAMAHEVEKLIACTNRKLLVTMPPGASNHI